MFNNLHSNERGSPSISTLNLSSNNFSKELANLASLNNSSDNVIENASSSVATTVSTTTATKPSSICDNHLGNNVNDVVIDLSKTSSTTTYTNGTIITECSIPSKSFLMLQQQQDNQNNSTDSSEEQSYVKCNVNVKNESHQNHNHQPSLPSTSSGHGAPNLFDLLANLENEIAITQQHLDDENDKRHKYKVKLI